MMIIRTLASRETAVFFPLAMIALCGVGWGNSAAAQDIVDMSRQIPVDLDGDGKKERIFCEKFAGNEDDGDFYQLRVSDSDGNLVWEGPKVMDTGNPFIFGAWHYGISLPELAADIDGDGAVELVTPEPQSDVSPTYFRVLRWKGGRFVEVRSAALMAGTSGANAFAWKQTDQWKGIWISGFHSVNDDGSLKVSVFEYDGGATAKTGEALVEPVAGGYQVKKWIKPMANAGEDPPAPDNQGNNMNNNKAVYRARLSANDHFNSKGERLTTVSDILRQDRANHHKGMGDQEDGTDSLFSTVEGRNTMDRLTPVPVGKSAASWTRSILDGNPLVEVEVTEKALRVRILEP